MLYKLLIKDSVLTSRFDYSMVEDGLIVVKQMYFQCEILKG